MQSNAREKIAIVEKSLSSSIGLKDGLSSSDLDKMHNVSTNYFYSTLQKMLKEGSIVCSGTKNVPGRGFPPKLFKLSELRKIELQIGVIEVVDIRIGDKDYRFEELLDKGILLQLYQELTNFFNAMISKDVEELGKNEKATRKTIEVVSFLVNGLYRNDLWADKNTRSGIFE
jgi:hypothetical protein